MSIDINESTFIYAYKEIFYKRYQGYMYIKEFFSCNKRYIEVWLKIIDFINIISIYTIQK